jgi:hypothetical protein
MRNFTTQDFEKYFFDIIENSFFEQEKKDFFSVLKTLNISKKELILNLFEELNKQTNQYDGKIEITIKDLPKSTLINKITTLIETGDLKYLNAAKAFSESLNSVFVIFMQELKKTDETLFDTSVTTVEKNKELIRERFNYDETKKNNVILIKEDFKGQHSFTLKRKYNAEIFLRVVNKLKDNLLVTNETSAGRFQKIFSGEEIPNNEKVDWEGTLYELCLFLKGLKPKLGIVSNIYYTALRCFTINGKEITKTSQISNSSGQTLKEQIIKDIILLF